MEYFTKVEFLERIGGDKYNKKMINSEFSPATYDPSPEQSNDITRL